MTHGLFKSSNCDRCRYTWKPCAVSLQTLLVQLWRWNPQCHWCAFRQQHGLNLLNLQRRFLKCRRHDFEQLGWNIRIGKWAYVLEYMFFRSPLLVSWENVTCARHSAPFGGRLGPR